MADYVKASDLEFVAQLQNFSSKLGGYKVALGVSDAEETSSLNDAEFMAFVVLGSQTAGNYKQSWTSIKNEARTGNDPDPVSAYPEPVDVTTPPTAVAQGVEGRFRDLVGRIKASAGYTNAIGEDLGIVADEDTTTLTSPQLSVELEGGNPVVSFVKSKSDGIRLYSKRGSESDFSFLAVDTRSPYVDNRPNENPGTPETRQYYAYFIVDDEQVGSQSDVFSIKV